MFCRSLCPGLKPTLDSVFSRPGFLGPNPIVPVTTFVAIIDFCPDPANDNDRTQLPLDPSKHNFNDLVLIRSVFDMYKKVSLKEDCPDIGWKLQVLTKPFLLDHFSTIFCGAPEEYVVDSQSTKILIPGAELRELQPKTVATLSNARTTYCNHQGAQISYVVSAEYVIDPENIKLFMF